MSQIVHKVDRRSICFTHHALDRWWDRCERNALHGRSASLKLLSDRIVDARWAHDLPPYARVNWFKRAMAEGFLYLDDDCGFIVNKDPNGSLWAVTYIENTPRVAVRVH